MHILEACVILASKLQFIIFILQNFTLLVRYFPCKTEISRYNYYSGNTVIVIYRQRNFCISSFCIATIIDSKHLVYCTFYHINLTKGITGVLILNPRYTYGIQFFNCSKL